MTDRVAIVWFRRNLRLADNPALTEAIERSARVVPVYVHAPGEESPWVPGPASASWLARSLHALASSFEQMGSRLLIVPGPSIEALGRLAGLTGAQEIHYDERVEPHVRERDRRLAAAMEAQGVRCVGHQCALLHDPDIPLTGAGAPYRVFTPYFNACRRLGEVGDPLPAPATVPVPGDLPGIPPAHVAAGIMAPPELDAHFTPGEVGALRTSRRFFAEAAAAYPVDRDRPGVDGTSRLSPHLAFGEIGPRQLVAEARRAAPSEGDVDATDGALAFIRQLYWREFAHHLLYHFPHTTEHPLREEFGGMPWAVDPEGAAAWRMGLTGYPVVDAGMRELAATGWMHNRVRMLVASLLTKDLLLPWQEGARIFWDMLADADLANNTLGWQWVAGSGADAAPYFRVFNPTTQGERYDRDGSYVRRWVPELAALPDRWLHRPHEAPPDVLKAAGITLGVTYPVPVVDHAWARQRALAAYGSIRNPGR
jgi:deoxyribodipyrimidine photo-lyase